MDLNSKAICLNLIMLMVIRKVKAFSFRIETLLNSKIQILDNNQANLCFIMKLKKTRIFIMKFKKIIMKFLILIIILNNKNLNNSLPIKIHIIIVTI